MASLCYSAGGNTGSGMGGKKRGRGRPGPQPDCLPKEQEKQEPVVVDADEIDTIFAARKRNKPFLEQQSGQQPDSVVAGGGRSRDSSVKAKKKKAKKREGQKSVNESSARPPPTDRETKRTEDGLRIYTEEALGFNKKGAGGTPLCPFDCDCCY